MCTRRGACAGGASRGGGSRRAWPCAAARQAWCCRRRRVSPETARSVLVGGCGTAGANAFENATTQGLLLAHLNRLRRRRDGELAARERGGSRGGPRERTLQRPEVRPRRGSGVAPTSPRPPRPPRPRWRSPSETERPRRPRRARRRRACSGGAPRPSLPQQRCARRAAARTRARGAGARLPRELRRAGVVVCLPRSNGCLGCLGLLSRGVSGCLGAFSSTLATSTLAPLPGALSHAMCGLLPWLRARVQQRRARAARHGVRLNEVQQLST